MSDGSSANQTPSNMPESSISRVLQRGGEELLLEKVPDRFTVHTSNQQALDHLVEATPAQITAHRAPPQLTELQVNPAQRDEVMEQLRASSEVDYASHVYRLQNSPGALVYLTDEITVQFADSTTPEAIAQIAAGHGLRQIKPVLGIDRAFVFKLTEAATENPLKICNRLMQRLDVLLAEPNIALQTQKLYRPKDPIYPQQWHLYHQGGNSLASGSHISVEQAWDITRGNRAIVVAIMDDSVDLRHPDFQGMGKIVAPRDFKDNDFMPLPNEAEDNHGTACAGVAVAEENGTGAVGVAPGCALMPIRTSGYLDDDTVEELFQWAVAKGAAVISCSWGPAAVYFPLSLRQRGALTYAATKGRNGRGCVIVFAAGNANRPTNSSVPEQGWPRNLLQGSVAWLNGFAAHPDVITVAASTSLSRKSAYSNWGKEISVCGPSNNAPPGVGLQELGYVYTPPEVRGSLPGLGIVTTDRLGYEGYAPGDFDSEFGGTSSACPLVAGVAALVLSANPDLTAAEVKQLLQQTADKIVDPNPDPQFGYRKGTYESSGRCDWFGYGKVNAFKAVQAATQRLIPAIAPSQRFQTQNTTSLDIPDSDKDGITSSIAISETRPLRDVQVSITLEHTFLGDLTLTLVAPSGQRILLQGRTLGRQTRLQTTYTLQTTPLLKRLLGQSARGTWQLHIVDHAQGDTGVLRNWQLAIGV